MRKIEKPLSLATAYKTWLDNINMLGNNHPKYNSSNFRFYKDIIANLLWVQKGLCAYTEIYLTNPGIVNPSKWEQGKINNLSFFGQLDHYDSTLKITRGWEWTNFFLVHSDVNMKVKNDIGVNGILKPDSDSYNPFDFLEYNYNNHSFKPNSVKSFEEQKNILAEINVLGLNFQPTIDIRKQYLRPIIDDIELGQKNIEETRERLFQFYTAFEMSILELGLCDTDLDL